jgi:beta-glucosidase
MTIYQDSRRSTDERVADLLARMSLDEKIAQLAGVWITDLIDGQRAFVADKAQSKIPHGIGHISRLAGAALLKPTNSATLANAVQRFLVENTRLGIPAVVHEESCAGYLARGATTFPQAIGLAATWEPELVQEMTQAIRLQMRSAGAHHTLAPVLDVARDARWGRVEETFGEDPYLIAQMGCAYIKGVQGHDLRQGIVATAKHFVGYAMSEGGMNWAPAHIPPRELWDVYLYPFIAAVREAHVASVMNAYHEMDGVPCGASRELLTDILRDQIGFDGVLVSDYFTINALFTYHGIAHSLEEAAQIALEAGIDVELPTHQGYGEPLRCAVEQGKVSMALIDTAVSRGLRVKFDLGLFEQPYVNVGQVAQVFDAPEPRALSLKLAQKSIVLLKNTDELLPLPADLDSIAVIGPNANTIRALQGDYHYPSHMEGVFISDTNMDQPNPMQDVNGANILDHFPPSIAILEGIQAAVSAKTRVHYAKGCDWIGGDTSGFAEAVEAAKKAKVAIVVVGEKSGLAQGNTTGESIDRADVGLPGVQQQLVEAIFATGTPVIVVLLNGRPLALPWIAEHIPAVVEAWLPAQEGGTAVANVLFGMVNPGGKLPMSFPRASAQLPVFYAHKPSGGRSHWQGQYCDMPTTPQFPFGHGLSYTRFEYSNLRITPVQVSAHEQVTVSLDLKNAGARQGEEVVQLYLHDRIGTITRPVKELKGFVRVALNPQEQKTITFHLSVAHAGFLNRDMAFVVEPGQVEIMIGSSSEDIRLSGEIEITGPVTPVERVFITPVEVR